MEPVEIRVELLHSRVRQADIARRIRVSPTTVHRVIERTTVSDPVQREIARSIGRAVEEVFPERYPHLVAEKNSRRARVAG